MAEVERLTNCTTGGPIFVDVEDGRIVRMFPIDLDEEDKGDWVIEARGRRFTPPRRTTLSPHAQAQRSMVYSPKRILTPLKRVDFDHKGKRNTKNRGASGYEPISWEAALDIIADEVERCRREAGPASILTTESSHHLWGNIGYRHSAYNRFLNIMGFAHCAHNPDSWEGWHWGAMPMWGNSHRLGIPEQYVRAKLYVYLIAAFGCGAVGAVVALNLLRVQPASSFSINWTAFAIFIVVIGGFGSIEGPIIGAVIYFSLQQTLSQYGSTYMLLLGVIAVVMATVAPHGIWGYVAKRWGLHLFPVRRRLVLEQLAATPPEKAMAGGASAEPA
jgi:hypothetical protein